jgi:hypothetical protein
MLYMFSQTWTIHVLSNMYSQCPINCPVEEIFFLCPFESLSLSLPLHPLTPSLRPWFSHSPQSAGDCTSCRISRTSVVMTQRDSVSSLARSRGPQHCEQHPPTVAGGALKCATCQSLATVGGWNEAKRKQRGGKWRTECVHHPLFVTKKCIIF